MLGLMKGKRGLVIGVANERSIAWSIAKKLAENGAELSLTYQNEALGQRVRPLAASIDAKLLFPCDVAQIEDVDAVFDALAKAWGKLDFVVHSVGYADKNELKGRYAETTRENFIQSMIVSCFSFTEIAKRAAAAMPSEGGSLLTITYGGSMRVIPNYNVMGVAKAALESSVRYLACDFGASGVRVNALSLGPVRTLAGGGVSGARKIFAFQRDASPLRRAIETDEIGNSALYLLSNLSSGVTGEVHYVDAGYNVISMPTDALTE